MGRNGEQEKERRYICRHGWNAHLIGRTGRESEVSKVRIIRTRHLHTPYIYNNRPYVCIYSSDYTYIYNNRPYVCIYSSDYIYIYITIDRTVYCYMYIFI